MKLTSLLPDLPFLKKTPDSEVFFALDINSARITAALWVIRGKSLQVLNTASVKYEGHEQMLEATNRALDEALADLPFNPTKVLFGVPDFWLQDDNLKEEYLKLLRHLTKELELEPMAFVSMSHAISHFLQKQTGIPTTAVLINYSDPLVVSIVKAGKIMGSRETKRSEDLAHDIEKVLLSFDEVEVMPSRILVFGQEKGSGLKEKLNAFPWMSKLPFLHLPKIDLLDDSVGIQAICFAGASELQPEVHYQPQAVVAGAKAASLLHDGGALSKHQPAELERAGFVAGDIEDVIAADDMNGENAGLQLDPMEVEAYEADPPMRRGVPMAGGAMPPMRPGGGMSLMEKVMAFPAMILSGGGAGRKRLMWIVPLVAVIALVVMYVVLVKVNISVFIDAKTMDKDAQVVADPSITVVDEVAKKIPGKVLTTSVSDTAKGTASGTKQIGDPAKGKVIIYNKTSESQTLAKGTVLASNGAKFLLDSGTTIASQSAQPGPNFQTIITPGKSDSVGVTAQAVGPDGNLPAGTNMSVGGFNSDQVVAQIDTAFSGGTSKTVTTVTADDQKRLLASLASDLRQKAASDLQGKLTGDQKILPEGLQENITSQKFSKNVGDQASDFNLTLGITYKGTSYSDNDLKTIISKTIDVTATPGYKLNLAESQTQATADKVDKDGKLYFTAKFVGHLEPDVNIEQLKNDIRGKTVNSATARIKQIENVVGEQFDFKPKIPGFLQLIPVLTKNINIEITSK